MTVGSETHITEMVDQVVMLLETDDRSVDAILGVKREVVR